MPSANSATVLGTLSLNIKALFEKLEVICVVLRRYFPELRKVSLHSALSIINRDVKAYNLAERAE